MEQRLLFSPMAILGALLAMMAIGALTAVYGPAIAGFKTQFAINDAHAGAGLAVQSLGAVIGVLSAPKIMRTCGNRIAMALSLILVALGSLAVVIAPSWLLLLSSAAVIGLGLGGVDLMVTQLLIFGAGSRGPLLVNVAHGLFGLGTVAAPGLIAIIGARTYWVAFLAIGIAVLGSLGTMAGLAPRPTPVDRSHGRNRAAKAKRGGFLVLGGFVVLYVTHFGVQSGIGNWEPTYLVGLGYAESKAALAASGFWLAMVAGRFIAAFLTQRVRIPVIVILSCAGMVLSLIPAFSNTLVIWALLACGFFIGPIFPNGLTWLALSGHGDGERFAYVMAASMLGMAVTPWAMGMAIDHAGLQVVPVVLSGIAAVAMLAAVILYRSTGAAGGQTIR